MARKKKTQSQSQQQKVSQTVKIVLGEIKAKRKKRKKKAAPKGKSEAIFIDNRQWQPRVIYGGFSPFGSNVETVRTVQQTPYQQNMLPIARETPRGVPQMDLQGSTSTQPAEILPPPPMPLSETPSVSSDQFDVAPPKPKPPPVERGDTSMSEFETQPRTSLPSARKGRQRGFATLQSILRSQEVLDILPAQYLTTLGSAENMNRTEKASFAKQVFGEIEDILSSKFGKDASDMTVAQIIREAKKMKD